MRLVILGLGGMGAITLSKMIAQMAINKGISVRSSEIHGMAKKGGLVEVQMKISEGLSGVVLQKEADLVFVLDDSFQEYGRAYLRKNAELFVLDDKVKKDIVEEFDDVKFISSFVLGVFVKEQTLFTEDDALEVIKGFREYEKNIKALKRSWS